MHEDEAAVLRRELPSRFAALPDDERRHGGPAVEDLLAATGRLLDLDRVAGDAVRSARTVVGVGAVIAAGSVALMPLVGGIALLAVNVVAGLALTAAAWTVARIRTPGLRRAPSGSRMATPPAAPGSVVSRTGPPVGSGPAAPLVGSGSPPGPRRLLAMVVLGLAVLLALLVAVDAVGVAVVAAVAVALATAVAVLAPRWWP